MTDIYVRRATLADKKAVLHIDENIYDGRDYLPYYYDSLITMDTTIAYVAEWGGNIVGFTLFSFVDDGQRAFMRAARTHVKYRKLGIFPMITGQFLSDFPEQWTKTTFCIFNTSPLVRPGRKILITRPIYNLEPFIISDVHLSPYLTPTPTLEHVTDDLWASFMTDSTFSRYLFPNQGIVIDSVYFSLMVTNIPLMRRTGGRQLMLTDCRRRPDGTTHGLLSVSSWFQNNTHCCKLDLFGSDLTSLQHHIAAHLNYNATLYPNIPVKSLSVCFEKTVDVTMIDKLLREIGLNRKIMIDKQGMSDTVMFIAEGFDAHDRPTRSRL